MHTIYMKKNIKALYYPMTVYRYILEDPERPCKKNCVNG